MRSTDPVVLLYQVLWCLAEKKKDPFGEHVFTARSRKCLHVQLIRPQRFLLEKFWDLLRSTPFSSFSKLKPTLLPRDLYYRLV